MADLHHAGPLGDVTVVEVATWVAAPSCGALMADMGARVLKVEPLGGDTMRGKLRQPSLPEGAPRTDFPFHLDNRGKESLAIDLADTRGASMVRDLATGADVFLTNLLPERLGRFGLHPDELMRRNPRLVYGIVSAYGTRGPEAGRPGFDLTAFFARSGIMSLIGEPDEPPPAFRPGQGDHTTGLALLSAVLAALRVRDLTGEGQVVETALLRTAAWSIGCDVSAALVDHKQPSKRSRADAMSPMNTTYRCADGVWVNLTAHDQATWPRFCRALERNDLALDERFATPADRFRNRGELIAVIEREIGSRPFADVAARLDASGVVWAKVATLAELVDDPQARANAMFAVVHDADAGTFETLAAPFVLSRSRVEIRGPAPGAGEHTSKVLRELGIDDATIDELRSQGVIRG